MYQGKLEWFSEMGSEGPSLMFVDEKAKYLSGYEQLELSYFFKHLDQFMMVVLYQDKNVYSNLTTFAYNSKVSAVVPQDIELKILKEWISNGAHISITTNKKLYADKIILKADGLENNFLLENIHKLMKTPDTKLSEQLLVYKKEFKIVEKCLKIFQKTDAKNKEKWTLDFFIVAPQSFLFGSKPIEVILRGDGAHLIEWLQERAGTKKPNPDNY